METVSEKKEGKENEKTAEKKKRGRPSVFTRTLGNDDLAQTIKDNIKGESARSVTNALYYQEGLSIAKELCDVHEIFFTPKGNARRSCILEQIGRMKLQNNFDDESCKHICEVALKALEDGYTVRQIEEYIRHGRNHNEW